DGLLGRLLGGLLPPGLLLGLRLLGLGLVGLLGRVLVCGLGLALARSGLLLLALLFLLLGLELGADELDDRHLRAVTLAGAEPEDAGVASGTAREPRAQRVEELLDHARVADVALHEAPCVETALVAAGQGDEPLGVGPELLRLHERRADALALE